MLHDNFSWSYQDKRLFCVSLLNGHFFSCTLKPQKQRIWETVGAFHGTDNRVFNGPLARSLLWFAPSTHSAYSLCSAPLFLTLPCLAQLCSWAILLNLIWDSLNTWIYVHAVHVINLEWSRWFTLPETRPQVVMEIGNRWNDRNKAEEINNLWR